MARISAARINDEIATDSDALLAAGAAIGDVKPISEPGFIVIPDGWHKEEVDNERFLSAPTRQRGAVIAHDVGSFVAYFNRFKTADSLIFADQANFRIVGKLDYHTPGGVASHREHSITYTAPRDDSWQAWLTNNGKKMPQVDFAYFVESNLLDIFKPEGAALLEIAASLHAKKKVDFVSDVKLSNGQREFTYSETIEGTTRKGKMPVPDEFTLGIPVFFGGPAYDLIARLRYRISDEGKLSIWYDLLRHKELEQRAFADILDKVAADTGAPVLRGVAA